LKISVKSKYVLLFLFTICSSSALLSIYSLQKLLNKFKNQKSNSIKLKRSKSSLISPNGSRKIAVPYKSNKFIDVVIPPINYDKYESDNLEFRKVSKELKLLSENDAFNNVFFNDFKKLFVIWKLILIPKIFDKNSTLLAAQIFFLIARTWLSLLVTKLDATIVRDLIGLKGKKFSRDLIYWFLLAFPASYTNSAIRYVTKRLALSFRTNVIRYIHDLYLDDQLVYYKSQFNDSEIKNIDQYITEDVKKFCTTLSSLFSDIGKPFIDLIFFSFYLRDSLGTIGITGIFINYFLTGIFLKKRSPNFSKLLKQRTTLEGIFYNYNLNLINNCEEISFYKGTRLEKLKIVSIFNKLMDQLYSEYEIRLIYQFWEDYILKYSWSALGYLFASIPIFFNDLMSSTGSAKKTFSESRNMKEFIINKRLMLSLADSGSRLMFSIKELSRLSGCTDRIFSLLSNLHQVHDFKKFQFGATGNEIKGTVQANYPGLRFEKLPIIIPSNKGSNGIKLINSLNFAIQENQNLLILGDNGTGKTSIMRVIASLWPIYQGLLSKPLDKNIMYISQKPYFLNNGNLRDQIIYPLNFSEMLDAGYNDATLIKILNDVGLRYLIKRFNNDLNFTTNNPWFNLLSGGERQKLIMARILFHHKKFVILDEPTNAMTFDAEDQMFEKLIKENFTIITISHRPLLVKYHDCLLEIKEG
ncbi:hypothetical protein PACTADRAFT_21035, partial [Pachysolen tannophilus NRRL Y-2460]